MKVVILCGGQGTRAYPYSRQVPKALMPVAGLPIVEQVMRVYARQGHDQFVLALGHLKEDIIKYFQGRSQWHVECVDTGSESDTGERLRRCLPKVGERFFATYCDGLGDVDLGALERFHAAHGDAATLTAAPLRSQYGILRFDAADKITEFVEKPVLPEHWINAGFFVFERDAIEGLRGDNLERDLLPQLAAAGRLRVYRHLGFWRSMDTYKDQVELSGLWQPLDRELEERMPLAPSPDVPRWLEQRYRVAHKLAHAEAQ
jgi:glucose-1-phosphate cytidylyltransferase